MLKKVFALLILITTLSLNSCATITPVSGKYSFAITPNQAQNAEYFGKTVRWGGEIIATYPEQNNTTCFIVLGLKLHSNAEPYSNKKSSFIGRFIACTKGYYDPEIYKKGREITFVGIISGIEKLKVGNYEYPYPIIKIEKLYLWPKRNNEYYYPYCNWNYYNFGSYSFLPRFY
ncbi:MAG: Slp family lipoprotein [Candidatus Parvarchaeota archaeon]